MKLSPNIFETLLEMVEDYTTGGLSGWVGGNSHFKAASTSLLQEVDTSICLIVFLCSRKVTKRSI